VKHVGWGMSAANWIASLAGKTLLSSAVGNSQTSDFAMFGVANLEISDFRI
jgi:hypothetical protein